MLVSAPPTPRRDRTAIAISIAVHCCVLALLALLPGPSFPTTTEPDERALLIGQIRIEHRPRPQVARARRPLAVPVVPQQQAVRPVVHVALATAHAARKMLVATEARAVYVPAARAERKRQPPTLISPATRPAAVTSQSVAQTASQPAPTTPPATPAPTPVPAQRDEGIGNFGETYPASVEPTLRASLFAGISGIDVRIAVDESGHATSVEFVRAPADAAQREELRSRLLAARFIPANCNGLRCSGTVELRN
jgi:hypothetical protein